MLLTRCPGCRTTFRITVQALEAADGQVRCGRCSEVFDAREALSELPAAGEGGESSATQSEAAADTEAEAEAEADGGADGGAGPVADTDTDTGATADAFPEPVEAATEDPLARTDEFQFAADAFAEAEDQSPDPAFEPAPEPALGRESEPESVRGDASPESERGDASPDDSDDTPHRHDAGRDRAPEARPPQKDAQSPFADHSSVASVIADIRRQQRGADQRDDDTAVDDGADHSGPGDTDAITSEACFAGDDADTDAYDDDAIPPEQVDAVLDGPDDGSKIPTRPTWLAERTPQMQASRWWTVAVAVAIVALAVQILHHYRSDLATHPALGDLLNDSYSRLGMNIVPSWDLAQYQIMEWVASAEADEQVQSSLNITARIQNRGPNPQPFPYVRLKLKDRWDMPVGSRVFRPTEYLDAVEVGASMQPGQTARARLRVVDPGEDAYGFELDVCVDAAQGGLRCATDEVFR